MSLEQGQQIVFGPFRFDATTHQLWHGEQTVALQPKPLVMLHYLAARPGQGGTKTRVTSSDKFGATVATTGQEG